MALKISFRADPPLPYHTSSYHIKQGFKRRLYDTSIRKEEFAPVLHDTTNNIRTLLKVPENYYIVYTNTSWLPFITLLSIQNQMATIDHSSEFSAITKMIRLLTNTGIHLNPINTGFQHVIETLKETTQVLIPDTNPFTGNYFEPKFIRSLKGLNSELNFHLDVSYSIPTNDLDYDTMDSFFFKSGYGFGLDRGPGVWLVKKSFFDQNKARIERMQDAHKLDSWGNIYCDPDIDLIKIYALGQIASDFNNKGSKILINETIYKSIVINSAIKNSNSYTQFIKDTDSQSKNIIVFTSNSSIEEIAKIFDGQGIQLDCFAYKKVGSLIRIGNYPAHSKEQAELLSDLIQSG